ncbi:MAG: HEAT repeat domain-containing protein [Porticoccaceae bacterium]
MNRVNSSQPSPYLPDHFDVITHPLVHFCEAPSFTNCLDILHNCCYLVDLFGCVDLDRETEDGLSEQAANAFFWQTRTLESTLRYVALCLRDVGGSQLEHLDKIKNSPLAKVLKDNDPEIKKAISQALGFTKDIDQTDIDSFIELLKT